MSELCWSGVFPRHGTPPTTPSHHSQFAPLPQGKGRGCARWIFQLYLTLAFCRTVPFPVTITDKGRFFKAVAELTGEFSVLFAGLALFAWTYNKNKSNGYDYRLLGEIAAFSHHLLVTVSSHLHWGPFFQWHANFRKTPGDLWCVWVFRTLELEIQSGVQVLEISISCKTSSQEGN